MSKNRWEPLHRLSSVFQISIAIFGGAAVDRLIQGVLGLLRSPILPWWGDMLLAAACSMGIFAVILAHNKRAGSASANAPMGYGLKILKADWGNEHSTDSVIPVLEEMPKNALAFHVDPHTLKCDPAPGVDEKYIDITYSFPGKPSATLRRKQHEWVVLPEDQLLKQQLEALRASEREAIKSRDEVQKRITFIEKAINDAASRPPFVSQEAKSNLGKAALLFEYSGVAEMLSKALEAVWHHWNNAGEKLIRPLSDERQVHLAAASFFELHSELLEFKILYRFHLDVIRQNFPNFSSNAIIGGFPSEQEYITVKNDLWNHGAMLKERAEKLWANPFVSATEGL